MNRKIIVIGSSNTDMVVKADRIPSPGETVLGGSFFMNAGGKGANQAVAAAKLGGQVTFVTKTGDDLFGEEARKIFATAGINTDYVLVDKSHASGVALITVDKAGENCITVAPGANSALSADDIDPSLGDVDAATIVLMQLEIPLPTVLHAAKTTQSKKGMVILNPAPAQQLDRYLLSFVDIITPNTTEAEKLTGIRVHDRSSAVAAARELTKIGVKMVIVTRGKEGSVGVFGEKVMDIPAPRVTAIDSTAAGDVFNGALAVALGESKSIEEAIVFANQAAALSVTKFGAQSSAPTRDEVEKMYGMQAAD